jgi:small-conductance mechanosensitive channel
MRKSRLVGLLLTLILIMILASYYGESIIVLLPKIPATFEIDEVTIIRLSLSIAVLYLVYLLVAYFTSTAVIRAGGKPGDVKMLLNLWRAVIVFLGGVAIASTFFGGIAFAAALGAFGGLFLGWSLQQPVTGLAAWLLINIRRPFRIGDRVFLPAWGIVGDVVDVGMMYTVLNQVGGTVGSEEPSGRYVLIPNAILFGNVVINYSGQTKLEEPYILDEVVVRITYDSDWSEAERIMTNAAEEVTKEIIEKTGQRPYIRSDFYDYGVYLRLRYMTSATERPKIAHEINRKIFEEFQRNGKVDFAIPFVYSHKRGGSFFGRLGGGKEGDGQGARGQAQGTR